MVMVTEPIALAEDTIQEFRAGLRGKLLRPGDQGYEEARRLWNGMIDKHPALIARTRGVADVIAAVNFARENNVPLAVRGGGHNVAGLASVDGGLVIDLSQMRSVRVDPQARTARAEGGATWGDVDRETQVFGLATPGGEVSATGIAGLTLGGGLGYLRRKYGLTIDNLLSVDIVTADGQFLKASESENPDLFWAVRGGGGNFGVVTSFEYRLHPVGPLVYSFVPVYAATPIERVKEILRVWRDFALEAPDEISSEAVFWSVPEAEEFPEMAWGQPVLILDSVYAGPAEEGERAFQPLRELGEPLLDLSEAAPYTTIQSAFDPLVPKGMLYYWKSLYLNGLGDEVIDALVPRAVERPSPSTMVDIWQLGGAISRVAADATAFGRRDAPFLFDLSSNWSDPADSEKNIAWTRAFWQDMHRFSYGGVYLNFPGLGEEKEELVKAAYGANYERLVAVKTKYDPGNLFRINHNIRPER
jgi:FAD/FMN-containing dehydrogenase